MGTRIKENALLENRLGIKSTAKYFVELDSKNDVKEVCKNIAKLDKQIRIIGDCTNILFANDFLDYVFIKQNIKVIERIDDDKLYVGGGAKMSDVVNYAINNSLGGIEWAAGLPGTFGGAVFGNAGAFGREIKDVLIDVDVLVLDDGGYVDFQNLKNKECKFGYRSSVFKDNKKKAIIIGGKVKIDPNVDRNELVNSALQIIKYRTSKHPMKCKTLGSTFKNIAMSDKTKRLEIEFSEKIKNDPVKVLPVAVLLDRAGLKGYRVNNAGFSFQHPNFMINYGGASYKDFLELISIAKNKVKNMFGVDICEEIIMLK